METHYKHVFGGGGNGLADSLGHSMLLQAPSGSAHESASSDPDTRASQEGSLLGIFLAGKSTGNHLLI